MIIQERIANRLPVWRDRIAALVKNHGEVVIDSVRINQVYGGMRDINAMVTDISHVDPLEGIRLRNHTIPEILNRLPKESGQAFPPAGGLYYLLMVGEIPTLAEAMQVEEEWKSRAELPAYVTEMLRAMPHDTHPMTLFAQGILALQHEAVFPQRLAAGMKRAEYWEATLEDSMNLSAKLPALAAFIYNLKYRAGAPAVPDPALDWASNFAHMIGKGADRDYCDLCRLYFVIHSDHESGNASAHTTHLVGSALSDIYLSCSAGMNALAGPLHGLANQECLAWLLEVRNHFSGLPTREQLETYANDLLSAGKIIPGYGHAVLRIPDPRFTAQMEFGNQYLPDDELFRLVGLVYEVLPPVLSRLGKVKNPWPNVDAISGALQYHYGVKEFDFYTVLFGISRILGVTSNAVWARALSQPLERPKSLTTDMIEAFVRANPGA